MPAPHPDRSSDARSSDNRSSHELAATIDHLPLLDHHTHGVWTVDPTSMAEFEAWISESSYPAAPGTSRWDTPVGLAIRRWCAPQLGLEPFATPDEYLARRLALGAEEANRRLLRATGATMLLLDNGLRAAGLASMDDMDRLGGGESREIVRLERVAEDVAQSGVAAGDYPESLAAALRARAIDAVGLKTIVAYRHGFDFDPAPPSRTEVVGAVGRWLRGAKRSVPRLSDPTVLRHVLWAGAEYARERDLPIQVHVGYGDPDLTLHRTDPTLLTDLLRRFDSIGVTVALLHCYPYHRQAAYLADMFPRVYLDLGLATTFAGASAGRMMAEALEVAPFAKLLFSSDGMGAAELHLVGTVQFRPALAGALGAWVEDGACTPADAERIARLVATENARRIYQGL